MTFYWWSHWFWITLMSNLIFPLIVVVHTYPSPESTLEYNQKPTANANKLVTRLYQTSTVTWTTDAPIYAETTVEEKFKLQQKEQKTTETPNTELPIKQENEPAVTNNNQEEEYDYYDYDATEETNRKLNLQQMEAELERKEEEHTVSTNKQDHEVDVKRSAEDIQSKTTLDPKNEMKLLETSTTATPAAVETNNYTNFTDSQHLTSTNTTANTLNAASANATTNTSDSTSTNTTTATTQTETTTSTTNATTQLPQAPSTPRIVKAQTGNLDWLNAVAAQLPPAHVTTDVTQDVAEEPHKIPFTLENVNKPEDLRREESEHRSRKSKGLSAEYKVNRYINYSSDSKNLLTRSAATTVNEYDSEESNISSEALSVQRAYFMDVGAISAICFTVFGICCTVGTVGIVLYRRRFLNKPQALSEPDSSVYIDDSTMRVSDNSDEMYSLDNDSFLNSLEAMTIQNYWTDTVKHTKL
ncbi:uncharacterized membrane protein DDB_G0293934 isoform X2 [Calliphora vicina]|uniref:uncharacterized membrane protein DDB_G0293934 isoform X2 n=1 Tax=Calliphora vicina TaxID=7373 RepID=UPI00325B8A21